MEMFDANDLLFFLRLLDQFVEGPMYVSVAAFIKNCLNKCSISVWCSLGRASQFHQSLLNIIVVLGVLCPLFFFMSRILSLFVPISTGNLAPDTLLSASFLQESS